MAQSLASLNVRLTLDNEDYRRRLAQANQQIASFGRDTRNSLGQAGRNWRNLEQAQNSAINNMREGVRRLAVGLAALASVNALKTMVTNAIDAANAADDFSVRIGITVEELSKLEFAAASSGIALTQFRTSMQRMTRRSAEAEEGTGVMVKALDSLNLSAQDLAKLSPDQQLRAIAEAMRGVTDQGERLKIAVQIFDTEGAAMLQMVDGLEAMRQEAEDLGLVLSTDMAKSATAFNAQLVQMDYLWDAVQRTVSFKLLPAINEALESAATFVGWLNKKIDTSQSVESLTELRDLYQEKIAWATTFEKATFQTVYWAKRVDELNEKIKETIKLKDSFSMPVESSSGVASVGEYEYIAPKPTKPDTGKDTSAEDAKAADRATARATAEMARKEEQGQAALDQLLRQLKGEEYAIEASHKRRVELADLAYQQTIISKEAQNKFILDSERKAIKEREALAKAEQQAKMALGAQLFGSIASLAESENGKLIEVQRAAAIAQATMSGSVAVMKAWETGPYIGPALAAAAAAQTAVQIATIAGARAEGGPVASGKTYLVGEKGPELFTAQSSGNITANSALGGGNITVNIIEDASKAGQVEQEGSDVSVFIDRAISATMDTLHGEFNSGRGLFASMEKKYGLAR